MGLTEKRKIKELQETVLPDRVKEIAEICGQGIPYEVDWEGFANDAAGLNFVDNVSCHRVNMALRVICQDDLGREAIREALRSIRLTNVPDVGAKKLTFDHGVLHLQCAYAQGLSGAFSDGEIREALMSKL
ncbi:MAG: hypothetical protein JSR82_19905 [Verrucomicrobia bacterium]|nr:hypothetical protein [Verrucomicrobiota bacterium]